MEGHKKYFEKLKGAMATILDRKTKFLKPQEEKWTNPQSTHKGIITQQADLDKESKNWAVLVLLGPPREWKYYSSYRLFHLLPQPTTKMKDI